MSRQYQYVQRLFPKIKEMLEKGLTHRKIEKQYYTVNINMWELHENASAENFFSILKAACVHRVKQQSFVEIRRLIGEYVYFTIIRVSN